MLPRIIVMNETSLDGCIHGFDVDMGRYYGLVGRLGVDAMLIGSNTVLAASVDCRDETPEDFAKRQVDPENSAPLWVITDSRGRLRNLHSFRHSPYCRDVVVLVSKTTPREHVDYLEARNYDYVVAGEDKVDHREALLVLHEKYGCKQAFTDSGGELNAVLLEKGLVDEVALLIDPVLVGAGGAALFRHLSLGGSPIRLRLLSTEVVEPGAVYVRYEVLK